jgi:Leucine rich repeat
VERPKHYKRVGTADSDQQPTSAVQCIAFKMDIGKDTLEDSKRSDSGSELDDVRLEEKNGSSSSLKYNHGSNSSLKYHHSQNLHDQLPDIEEYKTSQQIRKSGSSPVKVLLIVAAIVVASSILIAVGVTIGRDSVQSAETPTGSNTEGDIVIDKPEPPPNTLDLQREKDMATFLVNMGWANLAAMSNHASPQYMAAQWLAHYDTMKMPIRLDIELMNRYVLATLYFASGGNNWNYKLKFLSGSRVCNWNDQFKAGADVKVNVGVSCRNGDDAIHEIFLPNMNLKGTLPPEIGLLYELEDLNLFGNDDITGFLPEAWKNLVNLERLVLHNNRITGTLPTWIFKLTRLNTLNLANNNFYGPLPAGLGQAMPGLKTLSLEVNAFTGDITPLKGLASLDALYLGNNTFTGNLTDAVFDSWERLQILDISDNLFSGNLPSMLLAKDGPIVIDMHGNNFNGGLPLIVEGTTVAATA